MLTTKKGIGQRHDAPQHTPQRRQQRHADACAASVRFLTVSTLFLILGLSGLQRRQIGQSQFLHQASRCRRGRPAAAWPTPSSAAPRSSCSPRMIGLPIGFFAGIYLAEFGGKTFAFLVRYTADLLNGVPSIVIGIFAWTVIVVPHASLLRPRRRPGAEPDADSHHRPQHRTVSARSAARHARRRAGAGRK